MIEYNPDSAFHHLTAKQARFVDEYMIDSNASQAAARAGYSKATAGVIGNSNMQKPLIRQAIAELKQAVAERNAITVDMLIVELEEARKAGKNANIPQSSAMVAATMGKAKMLGFLTERVDHTTKGEKIQSGLGHFYATAPAYPDDSEDDE